MVPALSLRPLSLRLFGTSLFLVLAGLAACDVGTAPGGEAEPVVSATALGNDVTLAYENNPANPRPDPNAVIDFAGLRVLAIDTYDETMKGDVGNIFLEDFPLNLNPAPYSGVLAYKPAYSPPTFRPFVEDVVDINAQYEEYYPNVAFIQQERPTTYTTPELNGGTLSLRFDAKTPSINIPQITIQDIATYDTGRPWLSMLVTISFARPCPDGSTSCPTITNADGTTTDNQVYLTAAPYASKGRVSINMDGMPAVADSISTPIIDNELFDLATGLSNAGLTPAAGWVVESVTGIVTLFDRFQIAPRSMDDIKIHPAP